MKCRLISDCSRFKEFEICLITNSSRAQKANSQIVYNLPLLSYFFECES